MQLEKYIGTITYIMNIKYPWKLFLTFVQ